MTANDTDWPAPPTLRGLAVVLRPFTAADADAMAQILSDPDVIRLTGSAHRSAETIGGILPLVDLQDWYGSRSSVRDRLDLAVVERASGQVVGEGVLLQPPGQACI